MIEKENVVLEAGNWLLDGGTHPSLPAASLGPSVRTRSLQEQNMLHEVEGHVPQAPSPAATQQRTWAPTGSTKDAGNLGSMSRLGRFVALGLPLFNTRSSWSLRPPAPAAAWSKTVNIILQQDRGGRTVNGLWRPRQQASCTSPQRREEKRAPPKHRQSLCPHPRGTCKYRHAQKTPRGLGGMGNFFT